MKHTLWISLGIAAIGTGLFFASKIIPDDTLKSDVNVIVEKKEIPENAATFVYSGGCFWCTEKDSEALDGVYDAISGFTGGTTDNPKYFIGSWGDHREGSLVYYDPSKLSYEDLVRHAYNTIDYTDPDGQFCDRGHSYSPAIYYKTEQEKQIALSLAPKGSIVPVEKEKEFFPVRAGHQDYYKKNATRYGFYRLNCGRDRIVDALPKVGEIKLSKSGYDISHLTPLQEYVTQHEGTERAFTHEYHKNKEEGIYVLNLL